MSEQIKTPWHLWVIGVVSLLWNAIGGMDYFMTVTGNEQYMGQYTQEQLDFFYAFPDWTVASWGIAVTSALLGSLFLLLRNGAAVWMFGLSLITMLATAFQNYFLSETSMVELMGPMAMAFSAAITIIAIALLLYARAMEKRGVLR